MTRKLSEDSQPAGHVEGQDGSTNSLAAMAPEAHKDTQRIGTTEPLPAVFNNQARLRGSTENRLKALTLAAQILNGLGAYCSKKSRQRAQFYRRDLNWMADILLRVDGGERDLLRPWGE